MTPAQVARAALRLADALDVVRDEMGRTDACQEIITAHANAAEGLCDDLNRCAPLGLPSMPERPDHLAERLRRGGPWFFGSLSRSVDAWRSFGERLRAECERVAYNALVLANSAGADVAADITGETCGSYYCAQGGAGMTTITNVCRLPMGHAGLHGQPREVKRGA